MPPPPPSAASPPPTAADSPLKQPSTNNGHTQHNNSYSSKHSSPTKSMHSNSVCHGRVREQDFENMIPAQWWKDLFADDLYLKTDGDVVEDPEITKEEIRMLEATPTILSIFQRGLNNSDDDDVPRILDLCCGQGRHSIMLGQKYPALSIFGHDQSEYLITLAKERARQLEGGAGAMPTFTVGDCRNVPYESQHFDFVMVMGNSFGYFSANDKQDDDEGDEAVLKEINRLLKAGGLMVLDLADGDYIRENFSPRSWEWIDDETFACRERTLSADRKRLHSREVVVAASRGVVRDQFYSERLYGRSELVELLRSAGFEIDAGQVEAAVELEAPLLEDGLKVTAARELSQRGQDLGMMEQRLLIIAQKRDSPTAVDSALIARELIERNRLENVKCQTLLRHNNDPIAVNAHPSDYYKLPPPQFPGEFFGVVFGDTALPCREKLNGQWNAEDYQTRLKLLEALSQCGYQSSQFRVFESHRQLIPHLSSLSHRQREPVFMFNLCDEGYMNDALKELHVPALFEMLGVDYSGAGPVCLGVCYDKGLVNSTAAKLDIPTPKETFILLPQVKTDNLNLNNNTFDLEMIVSEKEKAHEIRYPAFVKPMKGDNSLGITCRSICHTRQELVAYVESLQQEFGLREFIVQEYLCGTEYSVGMLGNPETGFHFFPILQVDYSRLTAKHGLLPILGWESKWDPTSPYWTEINYLQSPTIPQFDSSCSPSRSPSLSPVDAHACDNDTNTCNSSTGEWIVGGGLTAKEEADLKQMCITLFERFGCRDYARFDWRADREVEWHSASGRMKPHHHASFDNNNSNNLNPNNLDDTNSDDVLSARSDHSFSSLSAGINSQSDSGHCSSSAAGGSLSSSHALRTLKLLEVNPNPGWCWDGKFAKMAQFEGRSYSDMVKIILRASWERLYSNSQ